MYDSFVGLPGLDRLRWADKFGLPPVEQLIGLELDDFASGTATYAMPAGKWLEWQVGVIPDGVLFILADSAHAGAVLSVTGIAQGFVTAYCSLDSGEPVRADGTRIMAEAKVLSADPDHVLSEVLIRASTGELLGASIARSSLLALAETPPEPTQPAALAELTDARIGLRPSQLAVEGAGLPVPLTAGRRGLDAVLAMVAGQDPLAPLQCLTGIEPIAAEPDQCTVAIHANEWLGSAAGSVQGGVLGLIAERAAWGAVLTRLAPGQSCRMLSTRINYLHRAPLDNAAIRAEGRIIHASRRVATVSVEITNPNGYTFAHATATVGISRG
jgi:uncharacterized protein (TIGR00369 family)